MKLLSLAIAITGWCSIAIAQGDPARIIFTNGHIFEGISEKRIENANVFIEGNLIAGVSANPIEASGAPLITGAVRFNKRIVCLLTRKI